MPTIPLPEKLIEKLKKCRAKIVKVQGQAAYDAALAGQVPRSVVASWLG